MERRVVITGYGIYSCLGENVSEVSDALYKGKSGIGFDPERKEMGFQSALTGIVKRPDLKGMLKRRERIGMAEEVEYAYLSSLEALAMAGMDPDFLSEYETGILFGNDTSARAIIEGTDLFREKKDTALMGSGTIFQAMNSTVTMNLSTVFRLRGVNMTISAACASGSNAIGVGYLMIKFGLQDRILCGGAQEVNWHSMSSFDGLGTFSKRENDPTHASRPFDRDRDGLVPSGGGASIVLEDLESAKKRGAKILGELVGYGFSSNGEHISNSNVNGPKRSIEMALRQSGLSAKDISYINAHATSTPNGDAFEAQSLHEVFGEANVPISSTKSMTGHECWMAGASEMVYSMIMLDKEFIAPNINLENPDVYSEKLNIATSTIDKKISLILSNSFGFGGTNSTLIVKNYTN